MDTLTVEPLTQIEHDELTQYEAIIERGLHTFVEVGQALLAIRDGRLYKADYGTFEDYCRDRWGWERRYAYRLMDAAIVVENVSHGTQIAPDSERQARPLSSLTPDEQREAWRRALDTAPDGKMTAAHVQSVVDEMRAPDVPELPHVAHNSGDNEWYTPPEYIAAAREVMGDIDCDPASSEIANRTVGATVYYDAETNGLNQAWLGRVWMNPPYAQPLMSQFCAALVQQVTEGNTTEAIVLVNNATETRWFADLLSCASAVCFPVGRVRFLDPAGNPGAPLQGQAVLYIGEQIERFSDAFSQFGAVLYVC